MAGIYSLTYFWIPRLVHREKYFHLFIAWVATILAATSLDILFQIAIAHLRNPDVVIRSSLVYITFLTHLFDFAIVISVFCVVIISHHLFKKNQENKQKEKDRLHAEINYLKLQLNPHFLFNGLNNIYILMQENVHLAQETLLKFSSLMQYQIYDSGKEKVNLQSEVAFISNFIEFEKIKSEDNINIKIDINITTSAVSIPPLLLIPFIENAFKHVSRDRSTENFIIIKLDYSPSTLLLTVENSFDPSIEYNAHGIGLSNARRRLDILLPNKHHLSIQKHQRIFAITLTLDLDEY
jgi:LytS/YehU family sensor histidine kinase